MAESLLIDAPFKQYSLGYVEPAPPEQVCKDDRGQIIDCPGTSKTLTATFAPFKRTQVLFSEGATPQRIEGRGELLDPLDFPSSVKQGSSVSITYAGRSWSLEITNIIPNDLEGVDLGAYFEGVLTPAAGSS